MIKYEMFRNGLRYMCNELIADKFPDGTLLIKPEVDKDVNSVNIIWNYEDNEEMVKLLFLTKHLQSHGIHSINLIMPYIPNARQDRVKNSEDVFTLKYFAEFINNLQFNSVTVLDPHSSVSEALINNIIVDTPEKYIQTAIDNIITAHSVNLTYTYDPIQCCKIPSNNLLIFYPDEGAMKRYSSTKFYDVEKYAFGIKQRDWETGKIKGLDVFGSIDDINNHNILIVDDISSRGGTFYFSAKKLKELGAKSIYLYVTHCEKTIFDGEIFKSGLIDKVFTTDSIFTDNVVKYAESIGLKNKIEVIKYDKN